MVRNPTDLIESLLDMAKELKELRDKGGHTKDPLEQKVRDVLLQAFERTADTSKFEAWVNEKRQELKEYLE